MSISLRGLEPEVRSRAEIALAWANAYRIPVTVTSAHRGWAEQTKLRAQYEDCLARGEKVHPGNKNPACRWPANKPGDSAHNYGMAWDSWVPASYQWAWNYLRRFAGFHVPEHDEIHAEVPQWRNYITTNLRRG